MNLLNDVISYLTYYSILQIEIKMSRSEGAMGF